MSTALEQYRQYLASREPRNTQPAPVVTQPTQANVVTRSYETIIDALSQILVGGRGSLEGITDSFLSKYGLAGGIYDPELRRTVEEEIKKNYTQMLDDSLKPYYDDSWRYEMGEGGQRLFTGVGQGVGQMLPALAVSYATGGLGASPALAAALANATFFLGAEGRGIQDALSEGATLEKAQLYGLASGSVELLTERLVGGATKNIFGKGVLDGVISKHVGSKLWRVGAEMIGEGFEEALAEIVNPYLKRMTYDKDAEAWTDEHKAAIIESAIVGGLTSLVFGQTFGRIRSSQQRTAMEINDVKELTKKSEKFYAKGDVDTKVDVELFRAKETLSKRLVKMDDTSRAEFIKQNKLDDQFNADGTVIVANEGINKEAMTPQAYNAKLPEVKIVKEVTAKQKETLRLGAKMSQKVVIADIDPIKVNGKETNINGYYDVETKTIVINSKAKNAQEVYVHELTHKLEGTKEYQKYGNFVLAQAKNNKTLQLVLSDMNVTLKDVAAMYHDPSLSEKKNDYIIVTEFIARATSEVLFTDKVSIAKLAGEQRSNALKILNWLLRKDKELSALKVMTPSEKAYLSVVTRAEGLYQDALEKNVGGLKTSEITDDKDKKASKETKRFFMDDKRFSLIGLQGLSEATKNSIDLFSFQYNDIAYQIERAKRLEDQGATRQEIKTQTGWLRSKDGNWKFEIDNQDFTLNQKAVNNLLKKYNAHAIQGQRVTLPVRLDSIVEDNRLFEMYPSLRKINLTFKYMGVGTSGGYNVTSNEILFNPDAIPVDSVELKEAIDRRENNIYILDNIIKYKKIGNQYDHLIKMLDNDIRTIVELLERDGVAKLKNISISTSNIDLDIPHVYNNLEKFVKSLKGEQKQIKKDLKELVNGRHIDKTKASQIKSTLLHEIQHAIQGIENWTMGSNPGIAIAAFTNELLQVIDNSPRIVGISSIEVSKRLKEKFFNHNPNMIKQNYYRRQLGEIEARRASQRSILTEEQIKKDNDISYEDDAIVFEYSPLKLTRIYGFLMSNPSVLYSPLSLTVDSSKQSLNEYKDTSNSGQPSIINEFASALLDDALGIKSSPSKSNILQKEQNVNEKRYSITKDSLGNTLSKEQQLFFKDSQVVDAKGNLRVVYHGTNSSFNTFDKSLQNTNEPSGDYVGKGFFFSSNINTAKKYGYNVIKAYLDIKKPLLINSDEDIQKLYAIFKNRVELKDDVMKELAPEYNGLVEYMELKENNPSQIQQELISRGYDGLIDNLYNQYAVFNPNQVKDITNKKPTLSDDMRYSIEEIKNNYIKYTDGVWMFEKDDYIKLDTIRIKAELRKQGIGTRFMNDLIGYADQENKVIGLTPSDAFGASSVARLKKFYQRFGFKPNKSHLQYSETMIRMPNDRRYSLEISGEEIQVEKENINDLVALHNISADKLIESIKLGGFPMPSIAITKPDSTHNNFGAVTVVFGRETIDPSFTKNKVWSGDRWTPTFPKAEYDTDSSVFNEVYFYMLDNKEKFKDNPVHFESSNIHQKLENLGKERFIQKMIENNDLKTYYQSTNQMMDFESWIKDMTERTIKKTGIYNGKDIYTTQGNRRSFDATHYEITLDNIVKVMVSQNGKRFGGGVGVVNASAVKNYQSINEIKKNAHKIVDDETYEKDREVYAEQLSALTSEIAENLKYKDHNKFFDYDNAETYIQYIGEAGGSKQHAKKVFDEFSVTYNDDLLTRVETFFKGLKNKLVRYFEAKPERAVKLSEIKMTLIPNNSSNILIKALETNKIPYQKYNTETESRSDIIKNMKNIRFSLDSNGDELSKEQQEYFKDSKARDKDGNLQVVYHGSEKEFTVFDRSRLGDYSEADDAYLGFHFTNNVHLAEVFGENKYKVYLNIKKPFFASRFDIDTLDIYDEYFRDYDPDAYEEQYGSNPENLLNTVFEFDEFEDFKQELSNGSFKKFILERGYDGMVFPAMKTDKFSMRPLTLTKDTYEYVAFEENQIKRVDNLNPTSNEDIRYSMSDETVAKNVGSKVNLKVYSKKDAEETITKILSNNMMFGDRYYGFINAKTKEQAVRTLWQALNTAKEGEQAGPAIDIANYIIDAMMLEDVMEENEINQADVEFIEIANNYKGQINLDGVKEEVKYHFGKNQNAFMVWGKRKGNKGQTMDTIAIELERFGIFLSGNSEQELFIEFYNRYKKAQSNIKSVETSILKARRELNQEEIIDLKNHIVREVLLAWNNTGKQTNIAKEIEKYQGIVKNLKAQLKQTRQYTFAVSRLLSTINRVSALEKYQSVESIPLSKEIVGMIKMLTKVKTWRGNLSNSKSIREIFKKYSSMVINADGKQMPLYEYYHQMNNAGTFGGESIYKDIIVIIAEGKGDLTTEEINMVDMILTNFAHNVRNFDKVFFQNREQSEKELTLRAIDETKQTIPLKQSGVSNAIGNYTRWVSSPYARFERLSNYHSDGFFSQVYWELHDGVSKQAGFSRNVAQHFEAFFKKHRKEADSWRNQDVVIGDMTMSRGQMISLYLLGLREQAKTHLYNQPDKSGIVRITNENLAKKHRTSDSVTQGLDGKIDEATMKQIEAMFTPVEKEFIVLTQTFFNQIAKDAKVETDIALFGVTNIVDGNYFPIRVAEDQLYTELGNSEMDFGNLFSVYNASFNKSVKPNANNKIVIENVMDVIERHTQQMGAYYGLAIPIKTFNRVWNKKLDGGSKLNIEVNKVDPNFKKFITKLLKDIQGVKKDKESFDRFMGKITGFWARGALGANPKVWATQFASLFAAGGTGIHYKHLMMGLMKGLANKTDYDMLYKYSAFAYDRARNGNNFDVGQLKQELGVLGKLDTITNLSTAPIGLLDNLIVGSIWNAALKETESKYKPNSEEHYKAAAKMTEQAVIRTQANWSPLYRPAILRTNNAVLKTLTMFTSEPLQIFTQIAVSLDRVKVARKELAIAEASHSPKDVKIAKEQLKVAKDKYRHYATAITVNAIFLAMVGTTFQWIKFGDEDDETFWTRMFEELTGHFVGMFPIFRDFFSLAQGYELSNMYETGMTNIYKGYTSISNMIEKGILGKEAYNTKDFLKDGRNLLLGISQTLGVPLRNIETYTKGILEKFNQDMIYKYESNFFNQSYTSDIQKALEEGNESLAETILERMMNDKNVSMKETGVSAELFRLYKEGYTSMPKAISRTVVIDDESVKLTQAQYNQFQDIYSQADGIVSKMITNLSYRKLDSEAQAKAIKLVYDYYHNLAKEAITGKSYTGNFGLMANAVAVEKLALAAAYASVTEADIRGGKIVQGSRKAKIERMMMGLGLSTTYKNMVMGYLGYSNSQGESQVRMYINRLNLTKEQKALLLSLSGY